MIYHHLAGSVNLRLREGAIHFVGLASIPPFNISQCYCGSQREAIRETMAAKGGLFIEPSDTMVYTYDGPYALEP